MNLNFDEDYLADVEAMHGKTSTMPVWLNCCLYFFISMSCCAGVVMCCGVIHDNGSWEDTPEFL